MKQNSNWKEIWYTLGPEPSIELLCMWEKKKKGTSPGFRLSGTIREFWISGIRQREVKTYVLVSFQDKHRSHLNSKHRWYDPGDLEEMQGWNPPKGVWVCLQWHVTKQHDWMGWKVSSPCAVYREWSNIREVKTKQSGCFSGCEDTENLFHSKRIQRLWNWLTARNRRSFHLLCQHWVTLRYGSWKSVRLRFGLAFLLILWPWICHTIL